MKMKTVSTVFLCVCFAAVAFAAPSTYTRQVQPLGNGYGIASIADTEPSTDPLYTTRNISNSGICSAFAEGSNWVVNGAMLDFGSVPGGLASAADIVGFSLSFNPNNPDTLNVWRNLVGAINSSGTGNIRSFGLCGVTKSAKIGIRLDGFSGGIAGSGLGILSGNAPTTTTFTDYSDSTYFKLLGGGSWCTQTWNLGSIGENQDLLVATNWGSGGVFPVGLFRSSFTGTGVLAPRGNQIVSADSRGTSAVNDTAKVIAFFGKDAGGYTTVLRVISYSDAGGPVTKISDNSYSFKNVLAGFDCHGANYFSQAAYRGPQQISINDNGDIAVPVSWLPAGDTSDARYSGRRGILYLAHGTSTFKVAVNNAVHNPVLLYDASGTFRPCFGGIALDNAGNVFFSGCNWMGAWGGAIVSTNAIFKATADNYASPNSWSVEPIAWRGSTWKEGSDVMELALLPLANTGYEYLANPAAFCATGLNRTPLPGKTDSRYSAGGLLVGAGLALQGSAAGLRMRALYIAPTEQVAQATTIRSAKNLADHEPVNLVNCVITGVAAPYIDVNLKTYYQFYVADKSHTHLRISTIRADVGHSGDLEVGDRICVSGQLATETTGERYLQSSGLVLVAKAKGEEVAPIAMINRSVGSGNGLSTEGMWVKTFGKVSNVAANSFDISDGSGDPITVKHNGSVSVLSGKVVSVMGDVTSSSPKTITMGSGDSVTQY